MLWSGIVSVCLADRYIKAEGTKPAFLDMNNPASLTYWLLISLSCDTQPLCQACSWILSIHVAIIDGGHTLFMNLYVLSFCLG